MADEQVQEAPVEPEPEAKAVEPEAKPAEEVKAAEPEAKPEVNWQEKAFAHQTRAVFAENGISDAEVRADILDLYKARGGDKDFDEWFAANKAEPKGMFKALLVQAGTQAKAEAPKPTPKPTVAAKADTPTVVPAKMTAEQLKAFAKSDPKGFMARQKEIAASLGLKA